MIFNSTIGLEASLMGVPVLTAGRARFTQIPTVFYPNTQQEYVTTLTQFLASEKISVPTEFAENARIFLYFQLFKSSLPFGEFLEASVEPTQSTMKIFNPDDLMRSDSLSTIYTGMFENGDFLLDV
jgi:hypothetical protein